MIENGTPIYILTTLRSRMLKATSTWDRDTTSETQNQDK